MTGALHALMRGMDPPCHKSLPPAGRLDGGGVRFYGWAPDPDHGWKQRISVHIRKCAGAGDTLLDIWFDTHEEAEAWVEAKNMAARR